MNHIGVVPGLARAAGVAVQDQHLASGRLVWAESVPADELSGGIVPGFKPFSPSVLGDGRRIHYGWEIDDPALQPGAAKTELRVDNDARERDWADSPSSH